MSLPVTNDGFDFKNKKCKSIFYNEIDSKGNKIDLLRIKNMDEDIDFLIRERLYRSSSMGISEDVLMEFISIKYGDVKALEEFFKLNGFLFNIGSEDYSLFKCKDLFLLIHRVRTLSELIGELAKEPEGKSEVDRPDIIKILRDSFYLLLTPPISFELDDKIIYKGLNMSDSYLDVHGLTSSVPFSGTGDDDHLGDDIIYWDSCLARNTLDNILTYTDYYENNSWLIYFLTSVYDFLEYIDLKGTAVLNTDKGISEHKDSIENAAKMIIKQEMDYHLASIRPTYNIEQLEASWDITDFISALYFSILFINPKFNIIKKCGKPDCINYFTVSKSNNRRIYCSKKCANAIAQRIFRQ